MQEIITFQRENQRISSSEILQALAAGEEIRLKDCTISGDLDINRLLVKDENFDMSNIKINSSDEKTTLTLSELIVFNSCKFEGNVSFSSQWEKVDELEVVFKKDVSFNSSVFCGQTRFSNTFFHGLAGFDGCVFERIASYRGMRTNAKAMFRTVMFDGYSLFDGAVFGGETRFTNTCFSKGGNFKEVTFDGESDFAGVYSKSKTVPIYESVCFARARYGDDETFWRFIKQASQEAGYYQLAGESFYNERCAHLSRKLYGSNFDLLSFPQKTGRLLWGIRLLPELMFGRLLFGYGERPIRVLIAGFLIILACGLFYALPSAQVLHRIDAGTASQTFPERLMDGFYFSTITFTTLGFGDMYPDPEHTLTRLIAMTEALAGACLMALFVVSLSKRYSRG